MNSPFLLQEYSITPSATVPVIEIKEISTGAERAVTLRQTDTAFGEMINNTVLTGRGGPVKRHIGMSTLERPTSMADIL